MSLFPFKTDVDHIAGLAKKIRKPRVKKSHTLLPFSRIIEPGRVLVTLPLQIVNEANCFEKWQVKAGRHKSQKEVVKKYLLTVKEYLRLPCSISFTRIAPRELDCWDNLPYSFKWCLDACADVLVPGLRPGRADGDIRIEKVVYNQEKAGVNEYGTRIEFIM